MEKIKLFLDVYYFHFIYENFCIWLSNQLRQKKLFYFTLFKSLSFFLEIQYVQFSKIARKNNVIMMFNGFGIKINMSVARIKLNFIYIDSLFFCYKIVQQ